MDITFRRATDADANALADLYIRARRAATDYIPSTVHTDNEEGAPDILYVWPGSQPSS